MCNLPRSLTQKTTTQKADVNNIVQIDAKINSQPKRKRAKSTPVMEYIRQHIWSGNYGVNKIWVRTKNTCNYYLRNGYTKEIPNWRLQEYFAGAGETLSFSGSPNDVQNALAVIDIDAIGHKAANAAKKAGLPLPPPPPGAAEKAKRATHFIDDLFKKVKITTSFADGNNTKIHWEPSTNGVGQAGYIKIGGPNKRETYERLEEWLKKECQHLIDEGIIEDIEIKGKPPEMNGSFCVTLGILGKLPRHATIDALKRLPRLFHADVLALPVTEKPVLKVASTPKTPSRCQHDPAELVFSQGSVNPCAFTYGMLDELHTHRQRADVLIKRHGSILNMKLDKRKDGKHKNTRKRIDPQEDVAILLMILQYFHLDSKEDGSLPHQRIYKFWRSLFNAGHIDRSACYERITEIRNWLSSLGLLEWQNPTFEPPTFAPRKAERMEMAAITNEKCEAPIKQKGRCCKWSISEAFNQWLLQGIHHTSLITTTNTHYLKPVPIYRSSAGGDTKLSLIGDTIAEEWVSRKAA